MSTRMIITTEDIYIIGRINEGDPGITLTRAGHLYVNQYFTFIKSFDLSQSIADNHILDDAETFDDDAGVEHFISYLYNLTHSEIKPNEVYFEGNNVIANNIYEQYDIKGE